MIGLIKCPRALLVLACGLSLGWSAIAPNGVSAQTPELSPLDAPTSEPTQVSPLPDNQLIRRDQAPLPIPTVYQTPIEQFEPPFSDVPRDHWAYEAVTRLFYIGTVKGYPESTNPSQF